VPRLINTLCETAMIVAFGEDRDRVNAGDLRAAISELGWVDYAARKAALERAQQAHQASLAAEPQEPEQAAPSVPMPLPVAALAMPLNPPPAPVLTTAQVETETREPVLYVADAHAGNEVLARLSVLQDSTVLGELALYAGRIVVGRTADNDLQIDSRLISRHHCQLVSTGEHSVIEDLGSTNGVVVGGRRLKRHVLKDGDVVQLGAHALRYADARHDDDIALHDLPPLEEGDVAA